MVPLLKQPKMNQNRPKKRLYTVSQAGEYLGLSVWAIRKRIYSSQIPYVSLGRRVMVDVQDLDNLIEENKVRAKQ